MIFVEVRSGGENLCVKFFLEDLGHQEAIEHMSNFFCLGCLCNLMPSFRFKSKHKNLDVTKNLVEG